MTLCHCSAFNIECGMINTKCGININLWMQFFRTRKIILRRVLFIVSSNYFKKSKVKVLRSPNIICMRLVEGKNGEKIGLFEYCIMITSFDYMQHKMEWLGPIFGIFHDLLTYCNHSNTWHPEYMTLCPHSLG